MRTLVSHFWRLVLSSGTRPLRWVSVLGATAVLLAPVIALVLLIGKALGSWDAPGWTSTMILLMVATGVILFSLGVIAEYVGMAVNMAMGKPLYLPVRDRRRRAPRPRREMTTRPTQPLTLVVGRAVSSVGTSSRPLGGRATGAGGRGPLGRRGRELSALLLALDDFSRARQGCPWSVAWCAGAGVVATAEDALAAEVRVFDRVMGALAASVGPDEDGVVFLASSAGGVYAGSTGAPFDERTDAAPLVPYGRAKLAMEDTVQRVASETGVRAVIGHLANVYGPGQTLGKPQGLLSQLCLADATGRPLPLYVSMDTIRDYLYVGDAATMIVRCLELVRGEPRGAVVTKVLSSGRPVTVGYLVSGRAGCSTGRCGPLRWGAPERSGCSQPSAGLTSVARRRRPRVHAVGRWPVAHGRRCQGPRGERWTARSLT